MQKELHMTVNISSLVLCLVSCAGLVCAHTRIIISAQVGSSAVLPCNWRNASGIPTVMESPHIEWRTMTQTVFERRDADVYQGEGYEGRVDVSLDKLLKGDCSLVLKDIKMTDTGPYESHMLVRRKKRSLTTKRVLIQSVELSVEETPEDSRVEAAALKGSFTELRAQSGAGINTPLFWTLALCLLPNLRFHLI